MKQLKTLVTQLMLATSLMLPWATAEALDTFEQAGVITELGYDTFVVRGQKYRIAPAAKLKSTDDSRKRFSDFKAGDQIYFEGKILNGIHYVDIIVYETPTPS